MANNTIYIGSKSSPTFQFMQNDIESIVCHRAMDIVGAELTADTLDVGVFYNDIYGNLANLAFGTPVFYEVDGDTVGKFFVKNVRRTAVTKFTIECTSIVGVLDLETHYGGMYYNANLMAMVHSIILADGLSGEDYGERILCDYVRVDTGGYITPTTYTATVRSRVKCKFKLIDRTKRGYIFGDNHTGFLLGSSVDFTLYVAGNSLLIANNYNSGAAAGIKVENGRTYEIDLDSVGGTLTIKMDDVTATVNISSLCTGTAWTNNNACTALHYCYGSTSHIDVQYFLYQVYNGSTKILECEPYVSVKNGKLMYRDTVTGGTCMPDVQRWWHIFSESNWTLGNAYVRVMPSKADIVNNITFRNGCYDDVVSGWIKPGTKRTALYQVLYSSNLCMFTNDIGDWIISRLTNGVSGSIDDDHIYDNGSEEKVEKTKCLYLTEHVYTQTSDSEVVFDNSSSSAVTSKVVLYSTKPVYGEPVASGITIIAYNCNAALISGMGTLSAPPYDHSQILHEYEVSSDLDGRDVSVPDATLVTILNVNNVMDRLKAFYNNNVIKVQNEVVYGGERCGLEYSFKNVFGENISARLASFTATVSSVVKLACIYYKNYIAPTANVSGYTHSVVIGRSQTWYLPSGVTNFHVVLIGGGNGGSSGLAGQDGYRPIEEEGGTAYDYPVDSYINKALGGEAGQNGSPGKVYEFDIASPASSYYVLIGMGGRGGDSTSSETTHNSGVAGGETTFGNNYSSESGAVRENGYTNTLTGQRYAYALKDYSIMQKGADGGYLYKPENSNNIVYVDGESVTNPFTGVTYHGGSKGMDGSYTDSSGTRTQCGGCGSGAMFDMDGINGGDGKVERYIATPGWGADAGSGSNAYGKTNPDFVPNAGAYGCGGYGGFGGAAGGSIGCEKNTAHDNIFYYHSIPPLVSVPGSGQQGGRGGTGVSGCVIIYY